MKLSDMYVHVLGPTLLEVKLQVLLKTLNQRTLNQGGMLERFAQN